MEQLCDWSLITEHFPLICQMNLPFGESDLIGLSTESLLCHDTLTKDKKSLLEIYCDCFIVSCDALIIFKLYLRHLIHVF